MSHKSINHNFTLLFILYNCILYEYKEASLESALPYCYSFLIK